MRTRPLRALAEVALGRQRSPEHETGDHIVRYLRAANVKDGALDLEDVKTMNFTPKEQRLFALRSGDVLVTEGAGSLAAIGASAVWRAEIPAPVCSQNTLLRLRPRPGVSSRYLEWWARSAYASGQFASAASGVNIFHLSAERVRDLPIVERPLAEQKAIADYLDAETARIDALIEKKRRMMVLLDEWFTGEIDAAVSAAGGEPRPLGHLTMATRQIMYGIVLPGPHFEGGVLLVKGGDVEHARLSPEALNRTDPDIEAAYARSRLAAGDVVIAIRGGIGAVEIVPPDVEGANITQDVARISPAQGIDGRWLYYVLLSTGASDEIQARVTGATIRGINIWDLKRVRVPLPSEAQRSEIAAQLTRLDERRASLVAKLDRQIALLQEHRQALITAAVTGELEIAA